MSRRERAIPFTSERVSTISAGGSRFSASVREGKPGGTAIVVSLSMNTSFM